MVADLNLSGSVGDLYCFSNTLSMLVFKNHLIFFVLVYMPLYFLYTVQREVTLNVNLVTFWRENADGRLCSPMASVSLITGLG